MERGLQELRSVASIGHVARVAVKIMLMYRYVADIPDSLTNPGDFKSCRVMRRNSTSFVKQLRQC